MNSLYAKFFQYLEDIGEQRVPFEIKLLSPDQFPLTPKDLDIKGNFVLFDDRITSLPDNLQVEGGFDLGYTEIESLPNNLQVGGDLELNNTIITSLPNDLQVGGDLYLNDTPLSSKTEAEIRQMAPGIKGKIWGLEKIKQ
jgi:hypothetical protein